MFVNGEWLNKKLEKGKRIDYEIFWIGNRNYYRYLEGHIKNSIYIEISDFEDKDNYYKVINERKLEKAL